MHCPNQPHSYLKCGQPGGTIIVSKLYILYGKKLFKRYTFLWLIYLIIKNNIFSESLI